MLRTTKKMKEKYENIQSYIFSLIPEKWEEIYLYASIEGEIFLYYLPKGIIKRRFINVYEVPQRFNINEDQYLKIVEDLCINIKSLKKDFEETEQVLWTSLTITISNIQFKIEYDYEELPKTDDEIYERNVIWKYNYLKIGGENKEERKILEEYFHKIEPTKKEIYESGLNVKKDRNIIEFGKEDVADREFVIYEKDDLISISKNVKNKLFSKNKEFENKIETNEEKENKEENEKKTRNQILDN